MDITAQVARDHHQSTDLITCICGHLYTQAANGDVSPVSIALHVAQQTLEAIAIASVTVALSEHAKKENR